MTAVQHVEPCGCTYVAVDVADDQGYGQGWERISRCGTCPRPRTLTAVVTA